MELATSGWQCLATQLAETVSKTLVSREGRGGNTSGVWLLLVGTPKAACLRKCSSGKSITSLALHPAEVILGPSSHCQGLSQPHTSQEPEVGFCQQMTSVYPPLLRSLAWRLPPFSSLFVSDKLAHGGLAPVARRICLRLGLGSRSSLGPTITWSVGVRI